jgi:transcription initiation factor TFIIIB Brf1 subunit/transcription initiation factor TFIIB
MTERCPNCGGEVVNVAGDRDAVSCVDCGLVNPETSQPETTEDSLSVPSAGDGSKSDTENIKKGWKSQVGITDSSDENLVEILSLVDGYVEDADLSDEVRIRAAEMLLSAWESDVFEGRRKESVIAGGVYAAARTLDQPRPLTKVSDMAGEGESTINNTYRLIVSELELEIPISGPEDYVSYIGRELSLSQDLIDEATGWLERGVDCQGNPAGIAASVLYLLARNNHDITLNEAGEAAGVSKETVWRHTQTIRDSGSELV